MARAPELVYLIVDAVKLAATSWFLHRAKRLKTTGWN